MGFKGKTLCIGIKSILKNCKNLPGIFDGFLGGYFGEYVGGGGEKVWEGGG